VNWFRFYGEVINDPKVQKLTPTMFKHWINVLCLASMHDGIIPAPCDVAFATRISEGRAAEMLDELLALNLLDADDEGTLSPHNWSTRQYKSDTSTERVKKHRRNVSVTPPDTEQNRDRSETETDASAVVQVLQGRPNIFKLYEQLLGRGVSPLIADRLKEYEQTHSEDCIEHCFVEAAESNAHSVKLLYSILDRHKNEGCLERKQMGRDAGGVSQARNPAALPAAAYYPPGVSPPVFIPNAGPAGVGSGSVAEVDDPARVEVRR
jgi:hypothetical protein